MTAYRTITSKDVRATLPTGHLRFIFDIESFSSLGEFKASLLENFFERVKGSWHNLDIEILVPSYPTQSLGKSIDIPGYKWLDIVPEDWVPKPNENHEKYFEKNQIKNNRDTAYSFYLMAMADYCQADGIITDKKVLNKHRYNIYEKFRIRIVPVNDFFDVLEAFFHGHSIFISVEHPFDDSNADVYYQLSHYKARRYFEWFEKIKYTITDDELRSNVHGALLQRYPYIILSRDMIKFYELQEDYYYRRGIERSYSLTLGYYLNYYMLLLWGMLDHLSVIANYRFELQYPEKKCSITNIKLWKDISKYSLALHSFIYSQPIQQWITNMADMRHHAAHKTIKVPTAILEKGSEPKMSDKEIREILRAEHREAYDFFPEYMESMEDQNIALWKIKQMKVLASRMIYIKRNDGTMYLIDPVMAVDHNLERLNAITDAVLCALFNTGN